MPEFFNSSALWLVLFFVALVFMLVFLAVFTRFARLWVQSVMTGAGIGMLDLIRMSFRKVNPTVITRTKIMAVQAGLDEEEEIYHQGSRSPLPGRRQCAAGDSLDDRRPQGEDHRPLLSSAPPRSTSPAATFSRPSKPAFIPASSTAPRRPANG